MEQPRSNVTEAELTEQYDAADENHVVYEKKPSSSRFKQQALPAWIPSFSMASLYWKFLLAAFIYIPVGVLLHTNSHSLVEIEIPYTDCKSIRYPTKTCAEIIENSPGETCVCRERFKIPKDLNSEVYIYYKLTNFYQNHRRYVKSKDDEQSLGKIGTVANPKRPHEDCEPYVQDERTGKFIIPCGAIANSMFNDSMKLFRVQNGNSSPIELIRTGIAWKSDIKHKFKNPEFFNNIHHKIWDNFTQPPDWGGKTLWELDPDNPSNNGLQNEDFIVWMRTAALPNFRKLHRIVKGNKLPAGEYLIEINYSYRTKIFGGTKSYVIQTTSIWLGGKNALLGILTYSVGGVALIVALVLLYVHINGHRKNNSVSPNSPSDSEEKDVTVKNPDVIRDEYILSILEHL